VRRGGDVEQLEGDDSQLSSHRPRSARSSQARGSPRTPRARHGGEGSARGCLVRFCATLCMLGAVAITAAVASLAASLYGQGKLSAEDAWQLVPPAFVPASMAVGAESKLLGEEVLKMREELKSMHAEVQGRAKRKRERDESNATDAGAYGEADGVEDDDHVTSVRSLQRQLSQAIVQTESLRTQLAEEQRLKQELSEAKRRAEASLQARETELLEMRRESEAALKELLKTEVARAREETEAKMRNEHLTSKHQSVEQLVSSLQDDLSTARAELRTKCTEVEALRAELMRVRSVLMDEGGQQAHSDVAILAAGTGEVALARALRADMKRRSDEVLALRAEVAAEREKRSYEEGARKKAEEEVDARKLAESQEGEKRRGLEAKLAAELEAKVEAKLTATAALLAREKEITLECDAKVAGAKEAAAATCRSECDGRATSATAAAAEECDNRVLKATGTDSEKSYLR